MDLKKLLKKYFKEENLTEDVQSEIETLFEATVKDAVDKKVAVILEEKETALEEQCKTDLSEFKDNLVTKLNEYLDYAITEWSEENKVEHVAETKVQVADVFVTKMKEAFKDTFIEISEEQVDVVADLTKQLEETKDKLDSKINDSMEDKRQLVEYEKAIEFNRVSASLSENQKDKFLSLIEDIEAADSKIFAEKITIIKDKFFCEDNTDIITDTKTEDLDKTLSESNDNEDDILKKYLPKRTSIY